MSVGGRAGEQFMKAPEVDPQVGLWTQDHMVVLNREPPFADGLGQRDEGAPERGACVGLAQLRPEQRGEGVTSLTRARCRQVGQQGQGFVAAEVHGCAVVFDVGSTEQV